jgi:uncharacterized membrane protein YbhN (UPF0104 family)
MRRGNDFPVRRAAVTAAALGVLAAALVTSGLAGRQLTRAWAGLAGASPGWLWLAVAAFLATLLCTALAWRSALRAAGAPLSRFDAAARYGVGSLVNSFAPSTVGDAVRITLLSRKLDAPDRFWTVGGAVVSVAALRGVTLAALVVAASATGALPLWPVLVLWGGAAAAAAAAWALRRHFREGRLGHFLAACTALLRRPRAAVRVLAWSAASQGFRVLAAAAIASALAVPHPLLAALVIVPTLQLATVLPIVPGNIGVASGAVALALQSRGVGLGQALAAGLAYHAAETVVGISFGVAGTLAVVRVPPVVRRVAVATATVAVAVGLGVTVLNLV